MAAMACLGLSTSQAALLSFQPLKASEWCVGRKFGVYRDSQTTRSNSTIRVKPGVSQRKGSFTRASLAGNSHIASTIFTAGTTIVIPFYTLMVFAPHSRLTKGAMESKIPYIVLGALYAYLLYQSWTPETLHLMFASKYWLPELPGITRMFSTELTVASAWLHLLAVDLFAARQVFHDGLKENIETRHSIILCLLFCPIGIMTHMVTKALTVLWRTFRGIKGTLNQLSTISND